jgi:lysophospholipase L1-like esterase
MKRIVCHGDSLTEGADLDVQYTWPSLVANALRLEVFNTGIGGDTSGGMLSRFPSDVLARNPDAVLILGGTNDLWWDLEVNLILAHIFSMACQARHQRVAPIIGLPIPLYMPALEKQDFFQPLGGYHACLAKLARLVESLRETAAQNDLPVVDFNSLFLDAQGTVRGEYYLPDGLHPNREGHRRMAQTVVLILRSVFHVEGIGQ